MTTLSFLKDWLMIATGYVSVTIDAFALIVVVIGSAEAAFNAVRHMFDSENNHRKREVWLRYARWLVAALTFQLAADIIETSIAPTWDDVGRFAVIAIIRTLLNYFLEKDLGEVRDRQRQMICSSSE